MSEKTTPKATAAWIVAGGSLIAAVGVFAYLAFDQHAKYEQAAEERNQLMIQRELAARDERVRADERQKMSQEEQPVEASQVSLMDTPELVDEKGQITQADKEAAAAVIKAEQDRTRAARARQKDIPEGILEVEDQVDREEATGQERTYSTLPPG